ncbi:MAG: chromosome segregation protein, partial [Planctomycetota bacterium]
MRLKRLVARGFKSFADRTEFEFDSRLTGIIGPNGCGKSNVVDAIKWVLGDQRAKSLRGSEMTDVIFKGAEGRSALGMAEVTITFEDPEGRLNGQTEIDISRRLTIDKESTYLINGSEVRLKDVKDVLLDTGLGTAGYSVMEQGRIDAVLSANPDARRAIFEEAAGVARFKIQKKETLRKLERTDQNLSRVTDLLEERARRIRSLRIQAGKAKRYQELQAALRDLRAALAVIDGRLLRETADAQRERLQDLQVELASAEEGRDIAADKLAHADDRIADLASALGVVQDELRACQNELTTHKERAETQRHRAQDRLEEIERNRRRSEGLVEQQGDRAAQLEMARDELAQKEAELVDLHKAHEEQKQASQEAFAAVRALHKDREAMRERQLELLHQRTRARNKAADCKAKIDAARSRSGRLGDRRMVLESERDKLAAESGDWQGRIVDLQTRERLLVERERVVIGDLEGADQAAAELAEQESALRLELSQVEGRRQALLAMESHMEGLDQAPRYVLERQPEGLRGRLLDLIEIDLAHGAALEAALGPFVQALVVDTREHAAAIVRDLAEKRLGRVLLLVEEAFGEQPPRQSRLLAPPAGADYLTELVRHVNEGGKSEALMRWLLRGVVLGDFDIADSSRADLCFVTPEGTLVCGPRMEGGAAAEGHAGLVVRKSQIQQLGEQADALAQRLAGLQGGKDRAVGRVDRLKRENKAVAEALRTVRTLRQGGEGQLSRLAARAADVERELGELAHEAGELTRTLCSALGNLGHSLFDQFLLSRREAGAQADEGAMTESIATAEAAARQHQQHEQELKVRQVTVAESREGLLRSIRMHDEALRDFQRALAEVEERQRVAEDDRARAMAEADRLGEMAGALEDRLAELEAHKQERQGAVDGARAERNAVQQELAACDQRRAVASEALTQAKLATSDLEHRFGRLEERLREETGIELRRCLGEVEGLGLVFDPEWQGPVAPAGAVECLQGPPLPPAVLAEWRQLRRLWLEDEFDVNEAKKEVQVLQSQKDRLGAVNLDAVQELADEEGQFGHLEQEVADLKEARRDLLETLKKLEAESKALFEQTFHEARKNFQEIFRKLFQGGKADMFLSFEPSKSEDLLEAGIEIVAQPPGKQLTSINLLSGGERSLTAVAILFALFKVRPSPFCILDEVDAALDETNVERFLRVLRDFTHGT